MRHVPDPVKKIIIPAVSLIVTLLLRHLHCQFLPLKGQHYHPHPHLEALINEGQSHDKHTKAATIMNKSYSY